MRKLIISNYAVMGFLLLLIISGFVSMSLTYKKYGLTYTETITIDGDVTTREVSLYNNLFATMLFVIIFAILFTNSVELKRMEPSPS